MSRRETQVYSLSGSVRCCFCGRIGDLWAGYDELGQWSGSHWPQGWHYNHTIYGYGPGRYDTGIMCEWCWETRQRPDWATQLPLVGM